MLLALDISTRVGWALGEGDVLRYGTADFRPFKRDFGSLSAAYSAWLADMVTEYEPKLIALERGFFRGPATYMLWGMIWDTHRVAFIRDVPRIEKTPIAIKKFVTGRHDATKDDVIAAVKARGYEPEDDHQADAIALHLLARS